MLVAALLHDSLEENATTTEELESRFGKRATYFVVQMTRREPDPATAQALSKQDLAVLRDNMLLEDIAAMDPEAWPIKLADRLSNLIQAKRLKSGKKLRRYLGHTENILKIIPKSANPGLWKAIRDELK
jgi:(p)ppGpp synthase/HD superfamily hydrolase